MHLVACAILFLAITAPWFVAVSLANPEFAWFFFVHEHFQRYTSTIHQRYQPWYFFIPILAAGILPWLVTLFDALVHACKQRTSDAHFDPLFFSLLWAGFIFAFFSASGSKLPSYILPIFPALALVIGRRLTSISGRVFAWQLVPVALLAIAGLIAAPYTIRLASENIPAELYRAQIPWLSAAGATLLTGMAAAMYFARRNRVRNAVLTCALAGLATIQLLVTSEDALSPAHSTFHAAQLVKPYLKPGMSFYSVRTYEQTLPFYIDRTVTLVEYQDEMAFGLQQEPERWIPTVAEFTRRWRSDTYALAVMSLEVYAELEKAGLPMQVVVRDTERIFVRTPPQ
jgi:4-amino-4-deoxy-L-arabinose transferase-like glycosyltransferase